MRIKKITVKNYRNTRDVELILKRKVTVIVGDNGFEILDCVSALLSWFIGIEDDTPISRAIYTRDDIHANASTILVCVVLGKDKVRYPIGLSFKRDSKKIINHIMTDFEKIKFLDPFYVPLLIYYPVNRSVKHINLDIDKSFDDIHYLDAYYGSFDLSINYKSFFQWFRNKEDLETEKIIDKIKSDNFKKHQGLYKDTQLDAARKAIEHATKITGLNVRRAVGRLHHIVGGVSLCVDHLPNHTKCLLAMIGDIARRLSILYQYYPDPLKGVGIVLIDEIDLHLHPSSLGDIIPNLVKIFPNCQFIVTTTSKKVINSVNPKSVIFLNS